MNAQIVNIEDRRPEVNPQKENGYTAIANEIMDELCKVDIPSTQIRVLLAVLRKTYGWNKKGDYISVSQLSKICVCSKRSALYALHNLEAKKIIKIIKNTGTSGEKLTSYIEFNKHYNEWVVQSLAPDYKQVIENTNKNKNTAKKEVVQTLAPGGAIPGKKVVQRFAHTKDNNKRHKKTLSDSVESENNQEKEYTTKSGKTLNGKRLSTFEIFWKSFNHKVGKAAAADSWLKIPSLTDALVNKICDAAKKEAIRRPGIEAKNMTPKMAQGWLTERRWEDEIYLSENSNGLNAKQAHELLEKGLL